MCWAKLIPSLSQTEMCFFPKFIIHPQGQKCSSLELKKSEQSQAAAAVALNLNKRKWTETFQTPGCLSGWVKTNRHSPRFRRKVGADTTRFRLLWNVLPQKEGRLTCMEGEKEVPTLPLSKWAFTREHNMETGYHYISKYPTQRETDNFQNAS